MPELPEVRMVVQSLQPLVGWTLATVDLRRPEVLRLGACPSADRLHGRRVAAVEAQGKQIWFTFDAGPALLAHLGMTGQFRLLRVGHEPIKHTHVIFRFQRGELGGKGASSPAAGGPLKAAHSPYLVRQVPMVTDVIVPAAEPALELHFVDPRRFGGLWVLPPGGAPASGRGQPVGPDAFRISRADFLAAMAGTRRQMKALLLDQRRLAGLGNIYADESLHRAGIHPLRSSHTLTREDWVRLFQAMKTVLRAAVHAGGTTLRDYQDANGQQGWFQIRHRVYGRGGQPCRTCGTALSTAAIAGRTTCWCPACQPRRPARTRRGR